MPESKTPWNFSGREGNRDSNDGAEDALLTQNLPERLALLFQCRPGLPQGDQVLAHREHPGGGADLGRRQDRGIGAGVPGEKVVDVVVGGVHSGGEGGPGHRRNGGLTGSQCGESSPGLQPLEVGQEALVHEALRQFGVHAVEAHHHHPGNVGFFPHPSLAVEEEAEQEPQGPGEERKPCQQDGQQENQERRDEGKARARTDVGLQGDRTANPEEQNPGDGWPQGFGFWGHGRKAAASPLGDRA